MPEEHPGTLLAVAVGRPREIEGPQPGGRALTAIAKTPVAGPVAVGAENLEGDDQADRVHHGGPDKAVYVYAVEDVTWWSAELGRDLDPQTFGQNLTTRGVDVSGAVVGERWRIGDAEFQVAQPRIPCWKFAAHSGDRTMPRRFVAAVRPGAYLRVLTTGRLRAGDAVEVLDRPAHGVTLADVFTVYQHERERADELLEVTELAENLRSWARERRDA